MITGKQLAKLLGITPQAVNHARLDGRITPEEKRGREYYYDPDRALADYHNHTKQPKATNAPAPKFDIDWDEAEDDEPLIDENGIYTDSNGNKKKRRSVLDVPSKFWTAHQAQNAKAIFDAQLKQLELDKEARKYLPTKEVESEVLRIVTEFSRALVALPTKLKQKIDKLEPRDLEVIKEICSEIMSNCESKL